MFMKKNESLKIGIQIQALVQEVSELHFARRWEYTVGKTSQCYSLFISFFSLSLCCWFLSETCNWLRNLFCSSWDFERAERKLQANFNQHFSVIWLATHQGTKRRSSPLVPACSGICRMLTPVSLGRGLKLLVTRSAALFDFCSMASLLSEG